MEGSTQSQFVMVTIKGSTLVSIFLIDMCLGTTIYYGVKIIFSSVLLAVVGSVIVTEGIKMLRKAVA